MTDDRIRNLENLPLATRAAHDHLQRVVRAAEALANKPSPSGRGAGQELIQRELAELRSRIEHLTTGTDALNNQLRSPYRLLVVGPSQVGKSTLINVLAGHLVLPTTGAGDAKTLKETILTYSSEGDRRLQIHYITRQDIQRRRFTLESYARKQPELKASFVTPWNAKESATLGIDDEGAEASSEGSSTEREQERRELNRRYATLIAQIKTIIYPEFRDQERRNSLPAADLASLENATAADWVDGWCMLGGYDTVAGGRFAALWLPRIGTYVDLLGKRVTTKESDVGPRAFRDTVERHTADGLAFLVDRVEVALPSADLEQMDVEDLPGVGNYQDPAADVARDVLAKAMRERALDGLLVVAQQNGIDQNTATLVEEAAVLTRVLLNETDLAVAITHIDTIAKAYLQRLEDDGIDESSFPSNDEVLRTVSEKASAPQFQRLKELLRQQEAAVDEPERSLRVDRVLSRTKVIGVEASAAEAFRFGQRRKIDQAFAKTIEGTGVPALLAHFKSVAETRHQERLKRVQVQTERIGEAVTSDLRRLTQDHDPESVAKLAEEARSIYVRSLETARVPLSNTWTVIRQRALSRLEDGIPAIFPTTSLNAQREARRRKNLEITRCERSGPGGGVIFWSTMQAALRYGGTWRGSHHIDLPGVLADALMPALVAGWTAVASAVEGLLADYRTGAEGLLRSLETAAAQAAEAAGKDANQLAIQQAHEQLKMNIESAITLLSARLDEITECVMSNLRRVLNEHFTVECERVLKRIERGDGVTRRALAEFSRLGDEAIEKGASEGIDVLRREFVKLRRQIEKKIVDGDPVEFAYRRMLAGIHDASEPLEIVEARASLVTWARSHLDWASVNPISSPISSPAITG